MLCPQLTLKGHGLVQAQQGNVVCNLLGIVFFVQDELLNAQILDGGRALLLASLPSAVPLRGDAMLAQTNLIAGRVLSI